MSHSSSGSGRGRGLSEDASANAFDLPSPADLERSVIRLDRHRRPELDLPGPFGAPASRKQALRALLVEDDGDDSLLVDELLARAEETDFEVEHVPTLEAGLARLASRRFDICLVDHYLPDGDGLVFLREAAARRITTPIILVSGQHRPELDVDAIVAGAADYIEKEEFDVQRLERAVRLALQRHSRAALQAAPRPDSSLDRIGEVHFRNRIEHAITSARRRRTLIAVLSLKLDLTELRARRDLAAADQLVETVLRRLRHVLRQTDTVTALDGDVLGVVVEEVSQVEHVALVATMIMDVVAGCFDALAQPTGVGASLGVALFPFDADEAGTLHHHARAAMQRAEARGDRGCCFHDACLEQRLWAENLLARELRQAIETGGLLLHFQPQVTLRSTTLGLASMVCWQHPKLGMIDQERIRSIAETAGLLEPLTDWVIGAACRQASRWQKDGLRQLHIAVPLLSRRQLAWSGLPERLDLHLARAGIAPGGLEIEIDERLLLDELRDGGTVLHRVRDLGVRLAVDRFGEDASSLKALRDVPLTTVKLARAMLQGTAEQEQRRLVISAVVTLARQLGLRVVAYGIDSQAQLQLLKSLGCDAVQAFISCPPLSVEACMEWLRQAAARS